jgi:O-antigen/teichoic acid export membrane protein
VAGVSIVLSAALVVFGHMIIHLWVGPSINPSLLLLAALGISSVLSAVASTIGVFLNGLSIVRFQVVIAVLGSIANIVISVYLTRRIGIPGVVYGTILSQFFIGFVPYYWYVRRFFKNGLSDAIPANGRFIRSLR